MGQLTTEQFFAVGRATGGKAVREKTEPDCVDSKLMPKFHAYDEWVLINMHLGAKHDVCGLYLLYHKLYCISCYKSMIWLTDHCLKYLLA